VIRGLSGPLKTCIAKLAKFAERLLLKGAPLNESSEAKTREQSPTTTRQCYPKVCNEFVIRASVDYLIWGSGQLERCVVSFNPRLNLSSHPRKFTFSPGRFHKRDRRMIL